MTDAAPVSSEIPSDRPRGDVAPTAPHDHDHAQAHGETEGHGAGPTFWVGMAAGAAIVGYGAWNLVGEQGRTFAQTVTLGDGRDDFFRGDPLRSAVIWIVAAALLLDLVAIPAAAAVGALARRITPDGAWPAVRGALLASGALVLVAAPLAFGWAKPVSNPTVRTRDYPTGLAAALVVVWLVAALVVAGTAWRRRARTA